MPTPDAKPSRALTKFRLASAAAERVPFRLLSAAGEVAGGALGPRLVSDGADQLGRHIRRVDPTLSDREVRAAVGRGFGSYARYWVESFRLPGLSADVIDRGFSVVGYHHIEEALDAGTGPILVLPHLGGWEWAAAWLGRVKGERVTAVVERLEPVDLYDWFVELREAYGIEVVPVGQQAIGRLVKAVRAKRIVCLLSDRDISGNGIDVEFFGEKTTLPAGPALLAKRTGAPLLPTAVYFKGRGHFAYVDGPVPPRDDLSLRDDIQRLTQELAYALERLISAAPDQWHLLGPNWPSDRDERR